MRELTYYVAATLDGFIAGLGGEVDAFDAGPSMIEFIVERHPDTLPTPARAQLGLATHPTTEFDTVLMGRSTYEVGASQGLTSPYAHLEQVVFSTTLRAPSDDSVAVLPGDAASAVAALKARPGKGIWLCGGGLLAGALIDEIDVLIVKRQPLVLGAGRPMFDGSFTPRTFHLVERENVGAVSVETHRRTPGGSSVSDS